MLTDYFLPEHNWYEGIGNYFGAEGYSWSIQTRVGAFTEEQIKKLLDHGLSHIFSGVEFGSARFRLALGKDFDLGSFKRVVALTNRYGASYDISLLVGYLGETEETVQETYNFAIDALRNGVNRVKLFIPAPFPGTPFTNNVVSKGLLHHDRIKGYVSVDPSTALHSTGKGTDFLSPERIEELYSVILNKLHKVVAGSNSAKGQENARRRGDIKFEVTERFFEQYEELLQTRLQHYSSLLPAYLTRIPAFVRL